jgi:FkbM family methyltransferase
VVKRSVKRVALAVTVIALPMLFVLGLLHPSGQWRARVVQLKLTGNLPELSWLKVVFGMIPPAWVGHTKPVVAGSVTFLRRTENGACPIVWQTPWGPIWGRFEDEAVLEVVVREQLVDKTYRNQGVQVREGDVVVDAGAHLGSFVADALRLGARLVVAFEPEPINAECLRQTFSTEIVEGRVVVMQKALWHAPGVLKFASDLPGAFSSARGRASEDGSIEVEAVTLDLAVEQLGLSQVDFIKMDIEGGERHALAGATETLRHFGPRMAICTYHLKEDRTLLPELALKAQPEYDVVHTPMVAYFQSRSEISDRSSSH